MILLLLFCSVRTTSAAATSASVQPALGLHALIENNGSVYNFTVASAGAADFDGTPRSIAIFRPAGSYVLLDLEVLDASGAVAVKRAQFLLCSGDPALLLRPDSSSASSTTRRRRRRLKGGRSGGRSRSSSSRSSSSSSSSGGGVRTSSKGISSTRNSGFSSTSGRGFSGSSRVRAGSFSGSGYKTPGSSSAARTAVSKPGGGTKGFSSSSANSKFSARRSGVGGASKSVRSSAGSYGYSPARLATSRGGRFPSGYRATSYGVSGRNAMVRGNRFTYYRPRYYGMGYYPFMFYGGGYGYGYGHYGYGRHRHRRYYDKKSEPPACVAGDEACAAAFPETAQNCTAEGPSGGCPFVVQRNMTRDDLIGAGAFDAAAAKWPLTVVIHYIKSFQSGVDAYTAALTMNISVAARCGDVVENGASDDESTEDAAASDPTTGPLSRRLGDAVIGALEEWDPAVYFSVTDVDDLDFSDFTYDESLAAYAIIMGIIFPLLFGALPLLLLCGGAVWRKLRLLRAVHRGLSGGSTSARISPTELTTTNRAAIERQDGGGGGDVEMAVILEACAVLPSHGDGDAFIGFEEQATSAVAARVEARDRDELSAALACSLSEVRGRGEVVATEVQHHADAEDAVALADALECGVRTARWYLVRGNGSSESAAALFFDSGGAAPPPDFEAKEEEGGRSGSVLGSGGGGADQGAAKEELMLRALERKYGNPVPAEEQRIEKSTVPLDLTLIDEPLAAASEAAADAALGAGEAEAEDWAADDYQFRQELPEGTPELPRAALAVELIPCPPAPLTWRDALPTLWCQRTESVMDTDDERMDDPTSTRLIDVRSTRLLCLEGSLCAVGGAIAVIVLLTVAIASPAWSTVELNFADENRTQCRALATEYFGLESVCGIGPAWEGCAAGGSAVKLALGLASICASEDAGKSGCVSYYANDDAIAANYDASVEVFFGIKRGRAWCVYCIALGIGCAAASLVAQLFNWVFSAYDSREADSSMLEGTAEACGATRAALCCFGDAARVGSSVRGGSFFLRTALPTGLLSLAAWFSFVATTLWFFFVDTQLQDRVSTFCFELSTTECCGSGVAENGDDDSVGVHPGTGATCTLIAVLVAVASLALGALGQCCNRNRFGQSPLNLNGDDLPLVCAAK